MFDRSKAIAEWRARLASSGAMFEADIDELESHLHDAIEGLEKTGVTGEEAFRAATEQLGDTRLLADEFAKINPLLVWRAALFWISGGVFLVLALLPLQQLAIDAVIASCMIVHAGPLVITAATWSVAFASPLLFFGVLFPWARRHLDSPLPWARAPWFRVSMLVGASVLMLASLMGCDWGWIYFHMKRWSGPMLDHAYHQSMNATYALAVTGPIVLGVLALRYRALAIKTGALSAPLFWLAVGLFIGCVRSELHNFVRAAALACAGLLRLAPGQTATMMWVLTLGCPIVLFASVVGYLRYRAPTPSRLLPSRGVLLALTASGAIAIGAVFATSPIAMRGSAMLTREVAFEGYAAWLLASIITSCALPVIVGAIMLSLRHAGSLAASRAASAG
jgi:hypothetical protein